MKKLYFNLSQISTAKHALSGLATYCISSTHFVRDALASSMDRFVGACLFCRSSGCRRRPRCHSRWTCRSRRLDCASTVAQLYGWRWHRAHSGPDSLTTPSNFCLATLPPTRPPSSATISAINHGRWSNLVDWKWSLYYCCSCWLDRRHIYNYLHSSRAAGRLVVVVVAALAAAVAADWAAVVVAVAIVCNQPCRPASAGHPNCTPDCHNGPAVCSDTNSVCTRMTKNIHYCQFGRHRLR